MAATRKNLIYSHLDTLDLENLSQSSTLLHDGNESEIEIEKEDFHNLKIDERSQRSATFIIHWLSILCIGVIFCLLVAYMSFPVQISIEDFSGTKVMTCGNTSEEARKVGCQMDLIDRTWIPRPCYDADLVEEFLAKKDWHWYASEIGSEKISREILERGDGPAEVWVTNEYHWVHCAYMWMKMHKAILHGIPIDSHLNLYKHTTHCAKTLAGHYREPNGRAQFIVGFSSCPIKI